MHRRLGNLKTANHHLSLQPVIIMLLVEGLTLMLMAADSSGGWMLNSGVAVAISENKTLSFAALMNSFFHNLSVVCNAL